MTIIAVKPDDLFACSLAFTARAHRMKRLLKMQRGLYTLQEKLEISNERNRLRDLTGDQLTAYGKHMLAGRSSIAESEIKKYTFPKDVA